MSTQTTTSKLKRENWNSQTAFLIAAIGSAIGLGNIWRFPGVAYENGGGAFLIPYIVSLLLIGIPVLLLDYSIGHKFRGSAPLSLRRISRRGEYLGWFQVGVSFIIFIYYAAVLAWATQYVIFSVKESWGDDPEGFFFNTFLQIPEGAEFSLQPVAAVAIPLALVWLVALFITGRGLVKGIEAANKVFLPLLVVLFLALVIRALFLPGAMEGLNAFFTPQWGALADPGVWVAAVGQIFFSLSVAFGIMITYASYLKPKSNLTGAGLVAGFANSAFEILAGIGVFAALGFMAVSTGGSLTELGTMKGVGLSFVMFPAIISQMPAGGLFGILFFSSLVLAGFTSLISLLQVMAGALEDKFGMSPAKATMAMGVPSAVISVILFGSSTGLITLDVMDSFINSLGIVGSALALTIFATFAGGRLPALRAHLNKVSFVKVPKVWNILIGVVAPIALAIMLGQAIWGYITEGLGDYSQTTLNVFGTGSVVFVLVFAGIMTATKWKANTSQEPTDPSDDPELQPAAASASGSSGSAGGSSNPHSQGGQNNPYGPDGQNN